MPIPSALKLLFIILLTSSPLELCESPSLRFVVWNVGQGQWTTYITPTYCLHLDTGGEYFPWKHLLIDCKNRKNFALFTHHDQDHINATKKFLFKKLNACSKDSLPVKKFRFIQKCKTFLNTESLLTFQPLCKRKTCTRNDLSKIFVIDNILISGDSPSWQEAEWRSEIPRQHLRAWVLGHHGSRTSNSLETFKKFHPKMAIVSARMTKYGHPHTQTLWAAQKAQVPILKTEDWGHIHLEL